LAKRQGYAEEQDGKEKKMAGETSRKSVLVEDRKILCRNVEYDIGGRKAAAKCGNYDGNVTVVERAPVRPVGKSEKGLRGIDGIIDRRRDLLYF